ncbi:unnamed protein product, partial [Polarella glacialis]
AAEVIVRDRPQVVQEAHQNSSTALCPLHIAILCGSYAIVELLLDGGANVNVRTLHDVTPLHLAATTSKELCMLLVSYAADLSQRDVMGTTAVHYAAAFKQHEALEMLLGSAGGQAQRLAGEGDQKRVTPLHISCALYSGREDLVAPMMILAAGAKPWQADVSGATALDVVPWSQDSELQRFFERCGDGAKPAAQAWLEEHYAYRGKVAGSGEANEDLWEEGETPLVSQRDSVGSAGSKQQQNQQQVQQQQPQQSASEAANEALVEEVKRLRAELEAKSQRCLELEPLVQELQHSRDKGALLEQAGANQQQIFQDQQTLYASLRAQQQAQIQELQSRQAGEREAWEERGRYQLEAQLAQVRQEEQHRAEALQREAEMRVADLQ